MAGVRKLLIFGACSLAISAVSTLANGQNRKSSHQMKSSESAKSLSQMQNYRPLEIKADASTMQNHNGDYPYPLSQPSVYQSVIERSTALGGYSASPSHESATGDLSTAAGHHHGHAHGKYYEYRAVPKKKTWKFGYKRGNHKHHISRHEHGKAGKHPHFKTKVKWHDSKSKGKGIHLWDYNHHDKKHYHHG